MMIDLDLLSGAIPHQVGVFDSNGLCLYGNKALLECYGISSDEVIGLPAREIYGELLASKYQTPMEQAVGGQSGLIQHTFPNRHEGRSWKTTFLPGDNQTCTVVSDDPGPLRGKGVRAQRTEERLQAFVDFAPIGMIFSHLDGRVLEANNAFLDLVEYTREELVQGVIRWDALTPTEFLHLDYEAIGEAKVSGTSKTYEKEYISKSGRRIHVLIGFILVGPNREEAVAFVVDITAQKDAEEEVRRLNAELEERVRQRTTELEAANRELEAFCYSVSHDLRAPLRSIDGFAYALFQDYEDKLDSEGIDFIGRIRASAKRMDELVSALLSLSRLTNVELTREQVDVSQLAETIAQELRQQAGNEAIQITIEPNLAVFADRRMLRAVLDNLFRNAVKFTAKADAPTIELGRANQSGPFFVKDNGVGFNMEESGKLFQPFERLHSPREFAGSGIGLATVQRIVRRHGGAIWAEAEVGKGATFFFTL